ncbi:MAG: 1-deoxy-D-xylulose-5-phosphate reductoisomerase [Rhodobacteraceae bacterium]|nr:1-deoxy-D-xylulose-5-phosphate reductoisomerase [Paracoccaceae bacterium]
MRRRISIFGATGSVGENTVALIEGAGGREMHEVVALTGGRNVARLAEQARALGAQIAVTAHEDALPDLRDALAGSGVEAAAGTAALLEAADRPADWTMSAIVGAAGLAPGYRSLAHGGVLALANKESVVAAGPAVLSEAARRKARIIPVDSEHSAIFQCLAGEPRAAVERIILTASGGPFRTWDAARIARATPAEAAAHPNWEMGQRISVDSASMFNKALEMIEARELFDVSPDQVEVVVHPQSIIHSMVGFADGAVMAHLGPSDMRGAIGYALNWPDRAPLPVERLDLVALARLDFEAPDTHRFPALRLAREALSLGGLAGAALNAAKEVALDHFLARHLPFPAMAAVVEAVLERMNAEDALMTRSPRAAIRLEDALSVDHLARIHAVEAANKLQGTRMNRAENA